MKYFDAHAHVQFPPYDADREEVLALMRVHEIGAVMVGVDRESSERAIALVADREDLYASVGLHPNDVLVEKFDEDWFFEAATDPKVVAIGECGLDYYRPEDLERARPKQREVFEQHLRIAAHVDKPLIIHARPTNGTMNAYEDLIEILTLYKKEHGVRLRGDIHFFVGGVEEAEALVALGFTISFTAVLTFARDYDEVVRTLPLTAILSETDAPYVAPEGRRGTRNDPLAVMDVVSSIASIRGEDPETVRGAILENAKRLFRV